MMDATSFQILVHRNHTYLYPRTHEGCDQTRTEVRTEHVISIHAPMKDATIVTSFPFSTSLISIHAPMKDATRLRWIELKLKQISIHAPMKDARSEEHTSELQSRFDLVCRLLLEKKKKHIAQ